eukprot:CAMPEP_0198436116 /NCGR_PEP_ID=MMETSP1452-20131203/41059_1 /TAXON_ID=1181717 /ORGANISM="Synchroma pusillum, Strain CCMP3072" /LENGTH=76 /DNA_ID=CAMNT_0044156665 /DNA_START=21 /DNA_END=251 /DNA_ORIENTATION=+
MKQPKMKVTREEMDAAGLPMHARDFCAHLAIPLNKCRRETFYMPWKCQDLRHAYEACQYGEYQRRIAMKKEADGAK